MMDEVCPYCEEFVAVPMFGRYCSYPCRANGVSMSILTPMEVANLKSELRYNEALVLGGDPPDYSDHDDLWRLMMTNGLLDKLLNHYLDHKDPT